MRRSWLAGSWCFIAAVGVNAQPSVDAIPAWTVVDLSLGETAVEANWTVTNETAEPMGLMVTRTLLETASPFNYPYVPNEAGSFERFCWGTTCYNFGADQSSASQPFLVSLQPGQSTATFVADFFPNGVTGVSTMEYCFHPVNDVAAGTCATWTVEVVDASAPIEGCTDPGAWNFDASADTDDGSCLYVDFACAGVEGLWWSFPWSTGVYANADQSMTVGVPSVWEGTVHMNSEMEVNGQTFGVSSWALDAVEGLPAGMALTSELSDVGPLSQACVTFSGTPLESGVFEIVLHGTLSTQVFGSTMTVEGANMGLEMEVFPNGNVAPGCTLPVAINYNPQASIDDGSCLLSGCTDENALNFHPAMTVDDGTCLYLEDFASSCPSDGDGDGSYGTGDLLQLLTLFGTTCN